MKSNNLIEINGHLYDARTGLSVSNKGDSSGNSKKNIHTKSIDDFTISPNPVLTKIKINVEAGTVSKNETSPNQSNATNQSRQVSPNIKRGAEHSTTLNRSAVKVPTHAGISYDQQSKTANHVTSSALRQAQSSRLSDAKQVVRHASITKYGIPTTRRSKSPTHADSSSISSVITKQPRQELKRASNSDSSRVAERAETSTKDRLIAQALAGAAQPASAKTRARKQPGFHIMRYASTALVTLLLAGYIAYLNVPSISMKVAAHRAGFAAAMPSYQPAGYSLNGPIAYSPGQVTVKFKSNTDQRRFSLKQQPTTWDSTALLENYVTKKNSDYLTYQDRGLTIYIYDGSNAAWVNNGKMFNLEGSNSQLDTDQLLKLATSV